MPWTSERPTPALAATPTPIGVALARGATDRCPACGQGRLFSGFLRVAEECDACGTRLGQIRADDAPPYFTIVIVGHLLVPAVFWVEKLWQPAMWIHMAVWLPLFAIACTLLLRPVKGAVLAWMMRLGLNGSEQGAAVAMTVPTPRQGGCDD